MLGVLHSISKGLISEIEKGGVSNTYSRIDLVPNVISEMASILNFRADQDHFMDNLKIRYSMTYQ